MEEITDTATFQALDPTPPATAPMTSTIPLSPLPQPPATDMMSFVAMMHNRMSTIEAVNRQLQTQLDDAKKTGVIDPDIMAHAAHVLLKFFPHDRPDTETPEPATPKFDPFTGEALDRRPKFDAFTGMPLQ